MGAKGVRRGRGQLVGSRLRDREFQAYLGRLRWRNYVVPSNSHPNDSWMIKACTLEVDILGWYFFERQPTSSAPFFPAFLGWQRRASWLEMDGDCIGRFPGNPPATPHGIKRLTETCAGNRCWIFGAFATIGLSGDLCDGSLSRIW